jgi:hypothetical protein
MEKQEDFFVGIYDPVDVRRAILESSKEIISSLQSYEKLEKLRYEKLANINKMKTIMKELDLLITKLKTKLPKSYLRKAGEMEQDKKEMVYSNRTQKTKTTASPSLSSDLDRLEEQMRGIEKELTGFKD